MGEIGNQLKMNISHTTFLAKTGRGDGSAEIFKMLETTQQAISALEDKVDALAERLIKEEAPSAEPEAK